MTWRERRVLIHSIQCRGEEKYGARKRLTAVSEESNQQ